MTRGKRTKGQAMARGKRTKGQTIVDKTLHNTILQIEQNEPTLKPWNDHQCSTVLRISFSTDGTCRVSIKRHEHPLIWKSC